MEERFLKGQYMCNWFYRIEHRELERNNIWSDNGEEFSKADKKKSNLSSSTKAQVRWVQRKLHLLASHTLA